MSDQSSVAMGMKDNDSHIVVKEETTENSPSVDPIQFFFLSKPSSKYKPPLKEIATLEIDLRAPPNLFEI